MKRGREDQVGQLWSGETMLKGAVLWWRFGRGGKECGTTSGYKPYKAGPRCGASSAEAGKAYGIKG